MKMINGIALLLVIVGAVNWGLVGAFEFNLVSFPVSYTHLIIIWDIPMVTAATGCRGLPIV